MSLVAVVAASEKHSCNSPFAPRASISLARLQVRWIFRCFENRVCFGILISIFGKLQASMFLWRHMTIFSVLQQVACYLFYLDPLIGIFDCGSSPVGHVELRYGPDGIVGTSAEKAVQ